MRGTQFLKFAVRGFVLGLVLAFVALPDKADTTYSYAGNTYAFCFGSYVPSCSQDHVNLSFTVSTPLAAGQNSATALPLTFSFTDGTGLTLNQADSTGSDFVVSTDSQGNISGWYIYTYVCTANCSSANYTESFIETSSTLGFDISMIDQVYGQQSFALCGDAPFCQSVNAGNNFGYVPGNGEWSESTSVGEPGSLLMLAAGLLTIFGFSLKKLVAST